MKASTLALAFTALFGSTVLAEHNEMLDADPFVCVRGSYGPMGDDGCWVVNGVGRESLGCPADPDQHYRHTNCHSVCCIARAIPQKGDTAPAEIARAHCENDKHGVWTDYLTINPNYRCGKVNTCLRNPGEAPSECPPM